MKYLQWNKVYQGRKFNIYSEVQFIVEENGTKTVTFMFVPIWILHVLF